MTILEVHNLKKVYTTRFGGNQVQALRNIQFSVEEGEYVAIMGESGSGKTTLLNILAALDRPTEGEVLLNGKNLVTVREKEIAAFRREHLGFVFQDFHLLDNFSLRSPHILSDLLFRLLSALLVHLLRYRHRSEHLHSAQKGILQAHCVRRHQHEQSAWK